MLQFLVVDRGLWIAPTATAISDGTPSWERARGIRSENRGGTGPWASAGRSVPRAWVEKAGGGGSISAAGGAGSTVSPRPNFTSEVSGIRVTGAEGVVIVIENVVAEGMEQAPVPGGSHKNRPGRHHSFRRHERR